MANDDQKKNENGENPEDKKAADEKKKAVDQAISQVERAYGKGAIMRFTDNEVVPVEVIPTGALSLDMALGVGGVPRGRIIEIFGHEGTGKTTLALHIVAEAQKMGGIAAFIDVEHALDTTYARSIGVNLENLLISQPDAGEQALEIVETLIRSGAIDVVIVDSVAALTPQAEVEGEMGDAHVGLLPRLMSKALRKLSGVTNKSKTCVIFTNQIRQKIGIMFGNPDTTPGGLALKFHASVRLEIRRPQQIKEGQEVLGNRVQVRVVKNKVAPPFKEAEFDVTFGKGISKEGTLLDIAVENGLIDKRGSWFSYNNERIGQGRNNVKTYLEQNPEVVAELDKKIRENFGSLSQAGAGEIPGVDIVDEEVDTEFEDATENDDEKF
ncbi:MAG: recombinase RecA [Candidatus Poribacteria bacterium]|nr:recombinase RecA [Candidatus Poribacteria bacterium]MDE0314409.1 recombinase RecA [Candidatus Poribacteria bacterium]